MTEQTTPQPSAQQPAAHPTATTRPAGSRPDGRREHSTFPHRPLDLARVRFQPIDAELFNSVAEEAARTISFNRNLNKASQLRRFYDELILWDSKVTSQPEKFQDYLPFIRMINAKVAYARGRNLVDDHFVRLMQHTLKQVTDAQSLSTCKLFWEAFFGFYKKYRPSD
ncbi:MAG: type III-A CRISPR-associated protein Csm2 [Nitrospira sp.]|nr:type III-A CRISPR-associated protein Csm2 [Nitrospira sp.]